MIVQFCNRCFKLLERLMAQQKRTRRPYAAKKMKKQLCKSCVDNFGLLTS